MKIAKEKLKKTLFFHLVEPSELQGFREYAEWLEAILHNPCYIGEVEGKECLIETRLLVDIVRGLKIEIYPNEHSPPHFHVKSSQVNAIFKIDNCEKLGGSIGHGDYGKIRFWHKHAKPLLIDRWNSIRPTDCIVGPFTNI